MFFRSIRHLQEASRADGKEELSLTKLKLFRQFYIMVTTYISTLNINLVLNLFIGLKSIFSIVSVILKRIIYLTIVLGKYHYKTPVLLNKFPIFPQRAMVGSRTQTHQSSFVGGQQISSQRLLPLNHTE